MKELWRKTANLFLHYPILWLPYVCAHLLNASVDFLQHAVFRWILRQPTTYHSVLGGAPIPIYGASLAKAAWGSVLMEWSLRYLTLCFDTVAIVLTAALVARIVRGERPRLGIAVTELRSYPKRILGYSFKLYFLCLVFAAFVSLPAARLSHQVDHLTANREWHRAADFALFRGQGLVSLILFAWIMIPILIRLLRAPGAEQPPIEEKRLGRYFVILTGVCAFALGAVLFPLLFKLVTLPQSLEKVYVSLVSFILSFPYLLGDIGVALIAVGGNWNVGEVSVPWRHRKLVRILMPLHSDKREQH